MLLTYFFKHKPQELHVIYRGMKKAFVSYKLKNLLFSCYPGTIEGESKKLFYATVTIERRLNLRAASCISLSVINLLKIWIPNVEAD